MSKWLQDGLEGRALKATLRLYVVGLMALAPAAALIGYLCGAQAVFQATPLLVLMLVGVEYGLCYPETFSLVSRGHRPNPSLMPSITLQAGEGASKKRCQALKTTYGSVYSHVSRLLREADPLGLIAMGAPDDEYDPEVSTILPRLREANAAVDVQRIVHEEFVQWFGADIAGPITGYTDVAERIWETWLDCGRRG